MQLRREGAAVQGYFLRGRWVLGVSPCRSLRGPGAAGGLRGHSDGDVYPTAGLSGSDVATGAPGKRRSRRARGLCGREFGSRWAMGVRSVLGLPREGEECSWGCLELLF